MKAGRSVLGVMAGVLLALGIVVLAGSGLNPYGMHAASPMPTLHTTNGVSIQSVTTTNTSGAPVKAPGSNTTFGTAVDQISSSAAAPLSQVNSIAGQPITLTGFVLLPIFAALLFGFMLYMVTRVRNEEDEPPEAA